LRSSLFFKALLTGDLAMSRPNKIWFRKDIGWWMVTVGGKRLRLAEGRENKKQAQQKFHELAAERPQKPEGTTARVADIIEAFLAWTRIHLSENTNRNYLWYGQTFSERSGYLPVIELKPIHLTRWLDEKGWNQTTQRNARRSIHRAFAWACEEGILSRNPLQGMKCPRAKTRKRFMSNEEYRALMRNSAHDFKQLLFSLQQTGCRPKETQTLTWEQVREDRWVLTEHKTAYKVQKPRVIYLSVPMRKLMTVLRARSTSPYVFLNRLKKPWNNNSIRLRIQRLKIKLNLAEDLCAYLLRHAFGTNAILNGVDVATVAELMGHTSLEMVSRVYLHLADQHSHLTTAVDKATRPVGPSRQQPIAARPGA
jgi:integrase